MALLVLYMWTSLPPVYSQTSLHRCAVCPGSILLADQLQVLILISIKLITDSSKNVRWNIPFKKCGMVRVKFKTEILKRNILYLFTNV